MSFPVKRFKSKSGMSVVQVRARRPIDKNLVNIVLSSTTSQAATTLITAVFPCTITGLRWMITYRNLNATSSTTHKWVIIRLKQAVIATTIATSDGSTLYEPEQEVITWGSIDLTDNDLAGGTSTFTFSGETKSMRKLMGGDRIQFVTLSTDATGAAVRGAVQFFCKS